MKSIMDSKKSVLYGQKILVRIRDLRNGVYVFLFYGMQENGRVELFILVIFIKYNLFELSWSKIIKIYRVGEKFY